MPPISSRVRVLVVLGKQQPLIESATAFWEGRPSQTDIRAVRVPARIELERVVIRVQDRFLLLKTSEVDWVESAGNYLKVHSRGRSFMLRMTMGELEDKLDSRKFVRIHRSTIVNIDRLVEVKPSLHGDFDVMLCDGTTLRMSRGYRDSLLPR